MTIHPLAWRRLGAVLIDGFIAGIIYMVLDWFLWSWLAIIPAWLFFLVRDALPFGFLERCSPGKRIMRLRAYDENGMPCGENASFKRNLPLLAGQLIYMCCLVILSLVPILGEAVAWIIGVMAMMLICGTEAYKVFTDPTGKRLGDLLAATHVSEM